MLEINSVIEHLTPVCDALDLTPKTVARRRRRKTEQDCRNPASVEAAMIKYA